MYACIYTYAHKYLALALAGTGQLQSLQTKCLKSGRHSAHHLLRKGQQNRTGLYKGVRCDFDFTILIYMYIYIYIHIYIYI